MRAHTKHIRALIVPLLRSRPSGSSGGGHHRPIWRHCHQSPLNDDAAAEMQPSLGSAVATLHCFVNQSRRQLTLVHISEMAKARPWRRLCKPALRCSRLAAGIVQEPILSAHQLPDGRRDGTREGQCYRVRHQSASITRTVISRPSRPVPGYCCTSTTAA